MWWRMWVEELRGEARRKGAYGVRWYASIDEWMAMAPRWRTTR